jgi:hypothetical protein
MILIQKAKTMKGGLHISITDCNYHIKSKSNFNNFRKKVATGPITELGESLLRTSPTKH